MKNLALIGCCLIWLVACDAGKKPRSQMTDHEWMVDTLATLLRNADPAKVYSMNARRAEVFKKEAERAYTPEGKRSIRMKWGEELLNAGDTEGAIEVFTSLIGPEPEKVLVTPENRRAFEFLALSYLRFGEQKNCQLNHSNESCVLPFRGGGVHTLRDGSETAMRLFIRLLEENSGDLKSRYLLNIAAMTLNAWPDAVPASYQLPASVLGREVSDFPEFKDLAMENGAAVDALSGGVVVADFNRDGRLDIMASSHGYPDPLSLLMAQPDGGFKDEMKAAGLEGITGGLNLVQADYDNDGDPDVLVLRGGWLQNGGLLPNSLLQNQGDGTFRDVTRSSGILSFFPTQTAAWADLNLDGWLDLVIGNEGHAIELFVNKGNGTFREMGAAAGLSRRTFVKGVTTGDYDNDGWPDIFCAVLGGPNLLYHNEGQSNGLLFTEKAAAAGVTEPIFAFPSWFWDYDQDGWPDLYVGSYGLTDLSEIAGQLCAEALGLPVKAEQPRLFRNLRDGTFADVTAEAGLGKLSWAMGSSFGDLDNNGYPDPFLATGAPDYSALLPNQAYRNLDGKRFEEVTRAGRFGHLQKGHGVAFADFDHDGDQDVYVVIGGAYEGDNFVNALYQNPGKGGHWVSLELEGTTANRSAIGALVALEARIPGGKVRTFYTRVGPGGSFGGNSLRAFVGLADAEAINGVTITWPDKNRSLQTTGPLALDAMYTLRQGQEPVRVSPPGLVWKNAGGGHHPH